MVRAGVQCFGPQLEHIIDFQRRADHGGWRPRSAPFDAWLGHRGDECRIAGLNVRLDSFGYLRAGRWCPHFSLVDRPLTFETASIDSIEPLHYALRVRGAPLPGVEYNGTLSWRGYTKVMRMRRAWLPELLRQAQFAEFLGFRYVVDGELDAGWVMPQPFLHVERRGGRIDGEIRRDGRELLVLFPSNQLHRLLPGDILLDPAITQERIVDGNDDVLDYGVSAGNAQCLAQYNNRVYSGQYTASVEFGAGFRFQSIPVPTGTTALNSANLRVFRLALAGTPVLSVSCDDVDNAAAWTIGNTTNRPGGTGYVPTTATQAWTTTQGFGSNNAYVAAGGTDGVTGCTQEAITRPGWANNNAIRYAVRDNGSANAAFITIEDLANAGANEATLDIDYQAAGGGGQVMRSRLSGLLTGPYLFPFRRATRSYTNPAAANVVVTDTASGNEAIGIEATVPPIPDAGAGLEAVIVEAALAALTDSGSGADQVSVTAAATIVEAGAGTDAVQSIAVVLSVAEAGSGADAETITVTIALSDSGSGAEQVFVDMGGGTLISVSDSGSGTEAIDVSGLVPIGETATGADLAGIVATLTTTDTAAGADAASIAANLNASDALSGSDALLPLTIAFAVLEAANGADALANLTVTLSLAELSVGTDAVNVSNPLFAELGEFVARRYHQVMTKVERQDGFAKVTFTKATIN